MKNVQVRNHALGAFVVNSHDYIRQKKKIVPDFAAKIANVNWP